jgi:hypothetical protein
MPDGIHGAAVAEEDRRHQIWHGGTALRMLGDSHAETRSLRDRSVSSTDRPERSAIQPDEALASARNLNQRSYDVRTAMQQSRLSSRAGNPDSFSWNDIAKVVVVMVGRQTMTRSEEFRGRADVCENLASSAVTPRIKSQLRDLAQQWRRLANQVEESHLDGIQPSAGFAPGDFSHPTSS